MGGHKRKGQSQRTKNNAKPSNSGRIANLVDNKGSQFTSFATLCDSQLPSTSQLPNISVISFEALGSNIDPYFQVVLKKINKKDATTRFKALQELKDLCKTSTPEVLNQVLPVWARIYCILAIDVEHKVREAVQEVHRLIVNSVGRNLAPYLKQIAPLWFVSQYDTYAPAASVASGSFKEAFSSIKMIEVITYCQAEILNYFRENILNLTPQSLCKGELNKDEMEAKYERIIISSLNGYALYLSKVPAEEIHKFKTTNQEILSSSKFWKLSKFKTPSVRSAWFTLISAISQHGIFLLENEKRQLVNSIIGAIDDYDSAVLTIVWEAALHSITSIKDFWVFVNIEKFFLLKFCNILKHGGQGNASFIYPNILLLLNSIPEEVIRDKHLFFNKIFTSFQEGMKSPLVTQSHSESDAVASSFVECIQFLIKANIEDRDFCWLLLEQHLFKVISTYMLVPIYRYQVKSFFCSLSHMLIFWYKNECRQENYAILLQQFWKCIINLSLTNLKNSSSDSEQLSVVLSTHHQLINIFYLPYVNLKKNLKVSFVDNAKSDNVLAKDNSLRTSSSNKSIYEQKLEDDCLVLAKELFQCYYTVCFETYNKRLQILLIIQMSKLIELININFNTFILCLKPRWCSSVLSWLKDTEIPMEHLLGIIFSSLEFLDPNEQSQLISELSQERCKESLKEALKLGSYSKNDKLKHWLQSEDMKKEICQKYEKVMNENNEVDMETIEHFFGLNTDGEFIIGLSTVISLIEKIEEQFLFQNEEYIKKGAIVINALFTNIASLKQNRYQEIVLKMIYLLFISIIEGHGRIVYSTWKKGMQLIASTILDDNILKDHVKKLSDHLACYIYDRDKPCDLKVLHHTVIKLIFILIESNHRSMPEFGFFLVETFLSSVICNSFKQSQKQIETICLYGDVISGQINSDEIIEDKELNIIKEKWNPLCHINIFGYVKALNFVVKVLSSVFGIEVYDDDNEDNDDDTKLISLPTLPNELKNKLDAYIAYLALGLVLLKKIKKYYYNTREYFDVRNYIDPFERLLKEIVQRCEQVQQKRIIELLLPNDLSKSVVLWSEVKELISDFLEGTVQADTNNKLVKVQESDRTGFVLEKNEIYKLRKYLKRTCLSSFDLNTNLKIVADKYKESFSNVNKDSIGIAPDFFPITTEVAHLLQTVIATHPILLSVADWDFARISVTKWLNIISHTEDMSHNYVEYVTMTAATCKLLRTISKTLSHEQSLENYCEEWRELFATDAYHYLCKHWKNVTEKSIKNGVNYMSFLHIVMLSETISEVCDTESFHKLKQPLNEDVKEWVDFAVICILAPCVPVQLTSYKLLQILLPNVMKLDEDMNESCLNKISCNLLEPKLVETQTVFMTMLQDFSVGVSCSVAPFTDSYTYSLAYLLLWSVLIKMCQEGDSQQKYIYPLWIKEKNIIFHFIEGVVKLMPESVIYSQEKNVKKGQELFINAPSFTFYDWTSEKMSHLSCWLLTELLASLPAVVRQWASEAEPKLLALVDRIVTAFVSPNLASREMSAINKQQKSFDNMKVYTHPSVREVVAVYTVEESSTELVVQLAINHPLSPPKVDISKAMISSNLTRQWLKQLTIFLTHQNGSIWDGLVLWKSNLDKKFEGIDECYICFSILHNTTHQLPKLSCHTCKKKFHSYCLYKWFSTSHKSTCPICRAIF